MSVNISDFGFNKEGQKVNLYTITNAKGTTASISDFGAILTGLVFDGKDVVLGFPSVDNYLDDLKCFGATVGPIANRIEKGTYEYDGVRYNFEINDKGNNLHSSDYGAFQKQIWKAECGENSVKFFYHKKHMEVGHPGEMDVYVTYTLTDEDELQIHYYATTDRPTYINMTNHSYFNLNGHDSGCIYDEVVKLNASHYTPVVKGAIPTGEISPVAGTSLDFTKGKKVSEGIDESFEQVTLVEGIDHNFVIDDWDGTTKLVATVEDNESHIKMETYSDLPGIQFYSGNFVNNSGAKGGAKYVKRQGLCLETQFYPNCVNQEGFPKPLYTPEKPYETTTTYKFMKF